MPSCRVPAARNLPEIFEDVSSQDDEVQPLRVEIDLNASMVSGTDVAIPEPHTASAVDRDSCHQDQSQRIQSRRDDVTYTQSRQLSQPGMDLRQL